MGNGDLVLSVILGWDRTSAAWDRRGQETPTDCLFEGEIISPDWILGEREPHILSSFASYIEHSGSSLCNAKLVGVGERMLLVVRDWGMAQIPQLCFYGELVEFL